MYFIFDGSPRTHAGQEHARGIYEAVERAKRLAVTLDVWHEVTILNGHTGTVVYRVGRAGGHVWGKDERQAYSWSVPLPLSLSQGA